MQGHLVNGVYPLGRYLGSSDHSGVFLTRSAARGASELAIKLVPADRSVAESLLPRWKRAGGLTHPNLLRLHEWGGCQLEGAPYLYLVMDYADQTLAQLLQSRALTEDEAREMLAPVLEALAFLHGRDLVQGQLKPANILVRGDQIQLASDTIRRVGDTGPAAHPKTLHDSPGGSYGTGSPAADIWALGISLCEALTRRAPSISAESGDAALPTDFAPSFREVVTRCLSRRPQDRPRLTELVTWASGRPEDAVPAESEAAERTGAAAQAPIAQPAAIQPAAAEPEPARIVVAQARTDEMRPTAADERPEGPRVPVAPVLGAVLSLTLVWGGWHLFRKHPASPAGLATPSPSAALPSTSRAPGPGSAASGTITRQSIDPAPPHPLREVVPDVPLSARRTVRGHINVWVRVIVEPDGSVLAAVADRAGPSRYFERLALRAAKQWMFLPVGAPPRRLMQIRFDFSRDGTRARALPLP